MGLGERTPLRGSQEQQVPPYVFMTDPNRAYKKKVRQLQCYLCSSILKPTPLTTLSIFDPCLEDSVLRYDCPESRYRSVEGICNSLTHPLTWGVADRPFRRLVPTDYCDVVYSVDSEEVEEIQNNGTLAHSLQSQAHSSLKQGFPTNDENEVRLNSRTDNAPGEKAINEVINQGKPTPLTTLSIFDPCLEDSALRYDCPESRYRSVEGICNSLTHPLTWGVADRPFRRLVPTDYCDGTDSPRCSIAESKLPSSLSVGSALSKLLNENIQDNNVIHMLWAHFIYQDLVMVSPSDEKGEAECCNEKKAEKSTCFPIEITKDSSLYRKYNTTCISFSRSSSVTCKEGKRMQLNEATSFLDGSVLYGNKIEEERKIRKFEHGHLAFYLTPENKYLPIDLNEQVECNISRNYAQKFCKNQAFSCISHNMNLPSMNLMMAKHHNFIASQLSSINPQWSDEVIFQNARRIVTAQIQHITYNEFLESTLGNDLVKTFGDNSETGYYEEYSTNIDATVSEAFALAFQLLTSFLPANGNYPGHNNKTEACNMDILGSQIQRGRDHGIPGYTKWREYCGLAKVTSFDQLNQELGAATVESLKLLYQNVEDIDLTAGLIAEMPKEGNVLGTIGSCIVSEQFKRTKTGDRFWFETSQKPQAFTKDQLEELQKTSLSRIICNNSKNLTKIQYNVMKETEDIPSLLCYAIPTLNLTLWNENNSNSLKTMNYYNHDDYAPSSIKVFMKSGNDFILQSTKAKLNVTKRSTSFTVNILNATLRMQNEIIYERDSDKPPYTLPLDLVADQSSYTPTAYATFSAEYNDDILEGSLSVPVKQVDTFQKSKQILEANFTAGISIKWGGSLILEPRRKYNCKIMFQSYAKNSIDDSPILKQNTAENVSVKSDSEEQCNILLVGTYYHRPFYCPLTPWWCLEGLIFYWSGEAKLIFVKPNPSAQNSLKSLSIVNNPLSLLGKTGDEVIEKTFASVTVVNGKISGQFNGEDIMTLLEGSPPVDIPLGNFINPNSFDTSLSATWSARPIDDRTIIGEFSVPYFPSLGSNNTGRKKLNANFSVDIIYKYGGSIGIIVPGKKYTCKTMFQGNKKLSLEDNLYASNHEGHPVSIKRKTPFGESCSITISGSFREPAISKEKIFHWSGDIELALKYKYNATSEGNLIKSINTKNNSPPIASISKLKETNIHYETPLLRKTDNAVVTKTFASVTVLKGKVTGYFNGEDPQVIMDGSPPIDINLDNFVNPNSFDTSVEATWSATPVDDNFVSGTFSLPFYPSVENYSDRRKFTANFSIDIIYKNGGSIGIIDPSKTYKCKVMFQANKKSNFNSKLLHSSVPTVPLKRKTPFGESCSITISGSLYEPPIFCKITPWWCSKEKIFHWSGDIELALKYKYNATSDGNLIKSINTKNNSPQFAPISKLKETNIHYETPLLGKTDNAVVTKTFASVTVLKGKVTGYFNGEDPQVIMDGSPPIDINLDNFVNPNSFDTSVEATWSAAPVDDNFVSGTFSLPFYPSVENYSDRRKFTANFSIDIIYKYGGSIGIIDPSKTYKCKVMFQANKKSNFNSKLLHSSVPTVPLKGKTPFGESCSITISGSFYEPSVFCYLTPWWCSKAKIFHWNGDIELALKYKFNASDSGESNVLKSPVQKQLDNGETPSDSYQTYPQGGYSCCGHRFGGKLISGWIETKTGGVFSSSNTIWSGEIPFEIDLPVFWAPTNDDGSELSNVYGHAVLWTASLFHSTIQGSFSFPQYIGHGHSPSTKWINGKFSFTLESNPYISLYDLIVPGIQYQSNLRFHNKNSPNSTSFLNSKTGEPSQQGIGIAIRAPIILLGRYTDSKHFSWNGTFVIDFSKTAKDLYYG